MIVNIYRGKTVLITGHTGFKGSWLAIWLKELGADVVGYALDPPSEPNNFETTGLREIVTHIHGDIRDLDRLNDLSLAQLDHGWLPFLPKSASAFLKNRSFRMDTNLGHSNGT